MSIDFTTEPSNQQVYDEFDRESVEHNVDDSGITVIGEQLGTVLNKIEKFIEEVVHSTALAFELNEHGDVKELSLARHYRSINWPLHLYSSLNGYSPFVDLFFSTALEFPSFSPARLKLKAPHYGDSEWHLFNEFIQKIRRTYNSDEFKQTLKTQMLDTQKAVRSMTEYVDALFASYARLLVVRIDLLYRFDSGPVGLDTALADFSRMLRNSRHNRIFKGQVGYIRRLEFGELRDHYHFHVLFFFDGSVRRNDVFAGEQLGQYWTKISEGRGHYRNCNRDKATYERFNSLGIGMVSHEDAEKRKNLVRVIQYLAKREQLLRRKAVGVTKAFTRGEMPRPKVRMLGRPRKRYGAPIRSVATLRGEVDGAS